MTTATFNAITYSNKLKDAGCIPKLAEVQAEQLSDLLSSTLATKADLNVLKIELQAFIVKSLITSVSVLGGLQALLHFIKI